MQLALKPGSTTFVSSGEGAKDAASVTINLDASTFGKIFSGKMTSQEAYMKGW